MSQPCIRAYHEMEERYARLEIEYFTLEQKEEIFTATNQLIEEFHLFPSQTITPEGKFQGRFCLEFNDDYDKESGKFFEAMIKKLNIGRCELG